MTKNSLYGSIDGGESRPLVDLFSETLNQSAKDQSKTRNLFEQIKFLPLVSVFHGHSCGIMDGFRKISREPLSPADQKNADQLEGYFEMTSGLLLAFVFPLDSEDNIPREANVIVFSDYPKKRVGKNPFVFIHENGDGVIYWNPRNGLVFAVPHDQEVVEVRECKPLDKTILISSK